MGIRIGLGLSPVLGAGGAFNPAALNPYAWYDAHLGGSSTRIADSSGNGRAAATFGATTAAPTWLPYTTPSVYLTGVASSYVSAPDSAALSFSNDIEVVCRIKPVDYTTAANQTIVGKYVTTGNQRSWRFYISTTGTIVLTASAYGTAVTSCTVTPSPALTDNTWIWLRLRLDLTNGSNSVGSADTAADTGSNDDVPTSWTSAGSATSTTLAGLFDSTAPLEIGSFGAGATERFNGWIGRMIVKSGFDGTTVADFAADLCGQTGYTASSPAVTWTVNRPAAGLKTVVQSPIAASAKGILLFDGSNDYATYPHAAIPPTGAGESASYVAVYRKWTTAAAGQIVSTRASTGVVPGVELWHGAAAQLRGQAITTGSAIASTAQTANYGTRIVGTLSTSGSNYYTTVNGSVGTSASRTGGSETGTSTGFIGTLAGSTQFSDMEFEALLTFARELSAAELTQIVAYYRGGS